MSTANIKDPIILTVNCNQAVKLQNKLDSIQAVYDTSFAYARIYCPYTE